MSTISPELRAAFNFYRGKAVGNSYPKPRGQNLNGASEALQAARDDVAAGRKRYASSPWRKPCGNGKPTAERLQWIESPAVMGLRFVGYCDTIRDSIRHTGWFTDLDQQSKIRGCVYQLPGRDGKARFVAAHDNEDNGAADSGGPALVDFSRIFESDFEAEMKIALRTIGKQYQSRAMLKPGYWAEAAHETARKEAAYAADELARVEAEKEREYQTAWAAGSIYAECRAEMKALRGKVLQVIRDMKGNCETLRALPASLKACIRESIDDALSERKALFAKMEKLKSGNYRDLIFYAGEKERAAFNEAAGATVI